MASPRSRENGSLEACLSESPFCAAEERRWNRGQPFGLGGRSDGDVYARRARDALDLLLEWRRTGSAGREARVERDTDRRAAREPRAHEQRENESEPPHRVHPMKHGAPRPANGRLVNAT